MTIDFKAVRGMKDIYGHKIEKYNHIVDKSIEIGKRYGYQIIETPILEYTELFQRSIGDETDVVSKEMYTFCDRGGESVTLRPEGTAGVVRSIVTEGMLSSNLPVKLMYYGPMFRYDRPQKGRYRQFHQIGFEHVGEKNPYVDALSIFLSVDILNALGLFDFKVYINSLGDDETKASYSKAIVKFFSRHSENLSEDSKRRLIKNPLRILDSKDKNDQEICSMAPVLRDYLSKEAGIYFEKVCRLLENHQVQCNTDNFLVRGLDYYCHTAFEIKTSKHSTALGGGGRYDNLVKEFGGPNVSGIGFAFGAERIIDFLDAHNAFTTSQNPCKFAVIPVSENENSKAFDVLKELLDNSMHAEFITNGNISKKMKIADKLGSDISFIIGESEVSDGTVTIKLMRQHGDEHKSKSTILPRSSIVKFAKHQAELIN